MSFSLSALLLLSVPVANEHPAADGFAQRNIQSVEPMVISPDPRRWLFLKYAQVRIQKRVIIRVPRRRPLRAAAMADFRVKQSVPKYIEKKIGKCVSMTNILGVQLYDGRELHLITRDRKRIRAKLEKKCQARSFYSGFYMEKSKDGKMCAGRDILHSRTGAKCEIKKFRQLVQE